MLRLALPAVNVLSKLDVAPRLAARLEVFTEPVDLGKDFFLVLIFIFQLPALPVRQYD